jgi:ATP-dependent DNA ligase
MQEKIVDIKIEHLKPKMKTLPSFKALKIVPDETIIQVKVDGEFSLLTFTKEGSFTVNRWGKARTDFPALKEFHEAMLKASLEKAELLCELYAKEDDRPLKLPDFIHHIKSGDSELLKKVHIGVFDLVSINGQPVQQSYAWKIDEVNGWLQNCRLCHVLPNTKPSTVQDVENFWNEWVEKKGYEGLVARTNDETYKIKPISEVDAVIVAINKSELFWSKQVTSIRIALMDDQRRFVEIGDCASGITQDLRTSLWKLMDFKVGEDDKCVWVKPMVICTVQYTDVFKGRNKVYSFDEQQGYQEVGTTQMVRLRHPRLVRFRPDKRVTPEDLRVEQIPMDFWKDVWAISQSLGNDK